MGIANDEKHSNMEDFVTLLIIVSIFLVFLLVCYIIWSYRPSRPSLLEYKYIGTQCDISWTCPTDEEQYKCHVLPVGLANIVPIKQYLVQMREDQGSWRTVATRSHGQPQKYRVEGLRIGAQVEFRMSSINILGRHSFPSDISPTYNVVDKPFPPGTPRVEDSIDDGTRSCVKTSCTLSWDKPSSNQGSPLTKYTICKTEDYCSWGLAAILPGSKLSCRVEGLVAGTVVQFNVIATNGVGDSKPSDTSSMYYVIDRPKQPKKPWFQEFTEASCTLNWEPPDFDGGAEITKYIIQRRENHGDWRQYTQLIPQAGKPLVLKILGLRVNARVTFRIIAANFAGESSPSTPSSLYAPEEEGTDNLASCSCSPIRITKIIG